MRRLLLIGLLLLITGSASAAILPLLTNNTFVYSGWVFGYSAFGSGQF